MIAQDLQKKRIEEGQWPESDSKATSALENGTLYVVAARTMRPRPERFMRLSANAVTTTGRNPLIVTAEGDRSEQNLETELNDSWIA